MWIIPSLVDDFHFGIQTDQLMNQILPDPTPASLNPTVLPVFPLKEPISFSLHFLDLACNSGLAFMMIQALSLTLYFLTTMVLSSCIPTEQATFVCLFTHPLSFTLPQLCKSMCAFLNLCPHHFILSLRTEIQSHSAHLPLLGVHCHSLSVW